MNSFLMMAGFIIIIDQYLVTIQRIYTLISVTYFRRRRQYVPAGLNVASMPHTLLPQVTDIKDRLLS